MKEKENILKKSDIKKENMNNAKNNKNKKNITFFKESEIVIKSIIEKIIYLVVSNDFKNSIEKNIPDFCFFLVKKKLDNIIDIQFIKHDKDDIKLKNKFINKSQKIIFNDKNKNILLLTDDKSKTKKLNKTQIIPDYQLFESIKSFNLDVRSNKNKKIFKRKNDFVKSDYPMLKKEEKKLKNCWDIIPQPKNSKVDRQASTLIKVDNIQFKKSKIDNALSKIINNQKLKNETENNKNKSSNFSSSSKIVKIIQKRNMISKLIENKDNEKAKKLKLAIQIDLPSFDLEQEKLNINEENEDIQQIRKDYITELNIKKEKEEKEKEKNLKKKKLLLESLDSNNNIINNKEKISHKNITTDQKGNIVIIKPIKLGDLINEFKGPKSYSKEIGKITDENVDNQSQKSRNSKNIKVELNENPIYQFNEDKTDKRRNYHRNSHILKKIRPEKLKEIEIIDKSGSKYASGSNFNLMKLECGVNLTENNKKKSGGKNFFEKFGKYSYEIYKNGLNRTMTENFKEKELIEINISNKKKEENDKKFINDKKLIEKKEVFLPYKGLTRENSDSKFRITAGRNHFFNLKENNLKNIMSNLDLMKDFEINMDTERNNISNIKYNIFKDTNNKNLSKKRKDFIEINKFNKSVMNNELWGEPHHNNLNIKEQLKPLFHLNKNSKENIQFPIIAFQRERLPPTSILKMHHEKLIKSNNKKNSLMRLSKSYFLKK